MRKKKKELSYLEILEKNPKQVEDEAEARRLFGSVNNVTWTKKVALGNH